MQNQNVCLKFRILKESTNNLRYNLSFYLQERYNAKY